MNPEAPPEFTPEQLAAMDTRDVIRLLRRNSGDVNFYWRVREAVLNRAADELEGLSGAGALRAVVQAVIDWNTKYPSSRIYGEASIRKIAAEMDVIFEQAKAAIVGAGWKPIGTAPKDGRDLIVGVDIATVWIVRSAWYRGPEVIEQQPETFDASDIGWWSYIHSVSQEKLDGIYEPTHWLCEAGPTPRAEGHT